MDVYSTSIASKRRRIDIEILAIISHWHRTPSLHADSVAPPTHSVGRTPAHDSELLRLLIFMTLIRRQITLSNHPAVPSPPTPTPGQRCMRATRGGERGGCATLTPTPPLWLCNSMQLILGGGAGRRGGGDAVRPRGAAGSRE